MAHGVDNLLTQVVLPGQHVNAIGGVRAHGEEADHGHSRGGLVPHLLQVEDHSFGIFHTHRLGYVLAGLRENTVWAPRPGERASRKCTIRTRKVQINEHRVSWK